MPQAITVKFDACQPVWDDMIKRFYVTTEFPNPLPDRMTIKDSFVAASLLMVLMFGGAVKRDWVNKT